MPRKPDERDLDDLPPQPTTPIGVGSSPRVDTESVMLSLDSDGLLGRGVRLDELEDEPSLPELHTGPEKYEVLRLIGEGGMGKVFLAFDRDLGRPVALKMIKDLRGERSARFLEEAQVIGQLRHPNIVPVFDLGLTREKRLFYTMPVVRGTTLREVLIKLEQGEERARRRFTLTRLLQLLQQVAQAVDYAHARGVVHRDLKPENIMLGEHGEVLVLDWGLSKVLGKGLATDERKRTGTSLILGTPAYMSPEQVLGHEPDARTDVYALGVMLYELLTGTLPFSGTAMERAMAAVREEPEPPRRRAPDRAIPLELEAICLHALRKSRDQRQESAAELAEEVQRWLESEADRAKRHERAEEKVTEGRERLAEYRRLREEARELEREAREVATRFEPWRDVAEKGPIIAAEEKLVEARNRMIQASSRLVSTLTEALGFEPGHPEARAIFADYYMDRFRLAEASGDREGLAFAGDLVARYHDGRYARELAGTGSLTLSSDPSGAEVWLHDLVEEGFVLKPRDPRLLGRTPLGPIELGMGSYLAVLRLEGRRDTLYPVAIARNADWEGSARLYSDGEIGPGMVHVPAGPFIQGGDPEARGWDLPRSRPWVDDYFIGRQPVTMGEYLEFLDDLAAREGVEAALRRSPRRSPTAIEASYLEVVAGGRLVLPPVDVDGDRWDLDMPAAAISWHDAVAYCAWRSAREGRTYRLPTESEWEKAARGVDGRWFPWGFRFDAALANTRGSLREKSNTVSVEAFPTDVSVYGVRGMAGNTCDWTASDWIEGEGPEARVTRIVRGGAWSLYRLYARCANRTWGDAELVHDNVGFRIAVTAAGAPEPG